MKRKVLSVLLASAMVASLAACGSSNDAPAQSAAATDSAAASTEASTEAYNLEEINVVVNGTLTATVDNGQAEFVQQWDDAVSEAIGHPIKMNIQQLDHSADSSMRRRKSAKSVGFFSKAARTASRTRCLAEGGFSPIHWP